MAIVSIYLDDSDARYLPDEQKWLCGSCVEDDPMGFAEDPTDELAEMVASGAWPRGSSVDCAECGARLAHDG